MRRKRSKAYWTKRAAQLEQHIQSGAKPVVDDIVKAYDRAIGEIQKDIASIFREFARASGIPENEAHTLVSTPRSQELYSDMIKLLNETTDEELRKELLININQQAYGARLDRLEAVKSRIYLRMKDVYNQELSQQREQYEKAIQKAYYGNIFNVAKGLNCGINFSLLPQRAIDKALNAPWFGANYSTRIWNNNEDFIKGVQRVVTDGLTAGHSVDRMAKELRDYAKEERNQQYITERLVRTETAHFMNEGQLEAYKDIGIEHYQFIAALSERTCDTCGGLDGEVFPVSEASEGDNYPPMHANCRCTTIMADTELSSRIARDPLTGENYKVDGDMTYKEWLDSLTPEQRAAMEKYVDNGGKSGIIKLRGDTVAKEEQRYGRNKSTVINKTYIESGEYRRKFDGFTNNPEVNRTIYDKAKEMLYHRSGTLYEDMYWIDSTNGNIIASALNEKGTKGIAKSKKRDDKIAKSENVIAIHTHPESLPPSVSDFNSMLDMKYEAAYVICHDGTIFQYVSNEYIDRKLNEAYIAKFLNQGDSGFEAQIKALDRLKKNSDINYWEVD